MDEIIDDELRIVSEDGNELAGETESQFNHNLEEAHGSNKQEVVDGEYDGKTDDPESIEEMILDQDGIQE